MVDQRLNDKTQWLSLRDACRVLEVSDTTLRQWANNGYLRVYRTPGGHRRFFRQDIESFVSGQDQAAAHGRAENAEDSVLQRIRRNLNRNSVVQQSWYKSVEEDGKVRMRLFGRRLLSLLLHEARLKRRRQELLEEAHLLGREYGSEMWERSVTVTETVEAFVFFRSMVLDSTNQASWPKILEAADKVLVGVVGAYQDAYQKTDNTS